MSERTFFCIRGFMKSGTNWLGALLNQHPHVSSVGEFHWEEVLDPILRREREGPIFGIPRIHQMAIDALQETARKLIVAANDPQATHVGDRTPHTLAPIVIPEARHLSIIRDGRDVLVSRVFHLFNNPGVTRLFSRIPALRESLRSFQQNKWFFREHPHLLLSSEELVRDSARWWREHFESDRRTVAGHPQLQVRFVRYEDLHADTEGVRRSLFEFLGVDPAAAPPVDGEVSAGFERERPNSFFRKGAIGDWKNYFTEQSQAWFEAEAGEELKTQGYLSADGKWDY